MTPLSIRSTKNGLSTPAEKVCSHLRFGDLRIDTTIPRERPGQQSALKNAMSTDCRTSSGNGTSSV